MACREIRVVFIWACGGLLCAPAVGGIYVSEPFRGLNDIEWVVNDRHCVLVVGSGVDLSLFAVSDLIVDDGSSFVCDIEGVPFIGESSRLIGMPSVGLVESLQLGELDGKVGEPTEGVDADVE